MTNCAVILSNKSDSYDAGKDLGSQILEELRGEPPHVLILFASSRYNFHTLLKTIKASCKPSILIGSSATSEFTNAHFGADSVCAIAILSDEIKFSAGVGRNITENRSEACDALFEALTGVGKYDYQYHNALILADAVSGFSDEVIDILNEKNTGVVSVFLVEEPVRMQKWKKHTFFGVKKW